MQAMAPPRNHMHQSLVMLSIFIVLGLCAASTDAHEDEVQSLHMLQKSAGKRVLGRLSQHFNASQAAQTEKKVEDAEFCYMHLGCFRVDTQPATPAPAQHKKVALLQQSLESQMDHCANLLPQELQMQLEALRHFHLFPQRRGRCSFPETVNRGHNLVKTMRNEAYSLQNQSDVLPFIVQESMYVSLLSEAHETVVTNLSAIDVNYYVCLMIGTWALLWGMVIVKRVYTVFWPIDGGTQVAKMSSELRPELASWDASIWKWLTVDWATEWIRRVGSVSTRQGVVKVQASDLGLNGCPSDEAEVCYQSFVRIWREEAKLKGSNSKVKLWRVLREFVGVWNILRLFFIVACQMTASYIGNVYLIEVAVDHIVAASDDPEGEKRHRVVIVSFVLAGFWGMPILRMFAMATMQLLNRRFSQQLTQALRLAVYYKAQRMPIKVNDEQVWKRQGKGAQESEPNLTNLVNYDIAATLSESVMSACQLVLAPLMMVWLIYIAYAKVGQAMFIGAASLLPLSCVMICLGSVHMRFANFRVMCGHERLHKMQEIFNNIRTVKSYGWDQAACQEIQGLRNGELKWLWWFWINAGGLLQMSMLISHFFVVFTLLGHIWIYGGISASGIFVCLQVMNNLKAVVEGVKERVSNFLLIFPSVARVERFLHMPESPKCTGTFQAITNTSGDIAAPALRVKGSFSWQQLGRHCLHDVDITVYPGELVGIVGSTGSGKSSLLHAMLGELWPSDDAEVKAPPKVAYCAQDPWIFEGSLRENIIFSEEYDERRFSDAISSAALHKDLEILPGGDNAMLGSRGVALSSGQQARVSLARAAYCRDVGVTLIDDPFSAVDASTSKYLLEKFIRGPQLKTRARVVCLQPEAEKITYLDRVIVLREGHVVFDGPPDGALDNDGFRSLLSSSDSCDGKAAKESDKDVVEDSEFQDCMEKQMVIRNRTGATPLREEEERNCATSDTIWMYCRQGGWKLLFANLLFTLAYYATLQMGSVTIARWSNNRFGNQPEVGTNYVMIYVLWMLLSCSCFGFCWLCGLCFSYNSSKSLHEDSVSSVLQAPIDKFWDKHHPGRIMNRMSADLSSIDMQLFMSFAQCSSAIFNILCPLIFIHMVMPGYFILLCMPLYAGIFLILSKYWRVMIPLRHLTVTTNTDVCAQFVEVRDQNVSVRAYNESQRMAKVAIHHFDRLTAAKMASECSIREWMDVTLEMICSVQLVWIALVGVLIPGWLGPGTMGLCLINSMSIMTGISNWIGSCSAAQFEFISLQRIRDLMRPNIPQEAAPEMPGDVGRLSHVVEIQRSEMASLAVVAASEGCLRVISKATGKPILETAANGMSLVFLPGASVRDLAPGFDDLAEDPGLTRIMAVNGIFRNAIALAEGLCMSDESPTLHLQFQGDWLAEGARVEVQDVCAGYGIGPNILLDVSFSIEAAQRAAVVGTTGSGKSTLLLLLLRILEPRSGRVLLDGVDTQEVGLVALRNGVGLVPQEPVLFSGTIRYNLDPFGRFSDGLIWEALRAVSLLEFVRGLEGQLNCKVIDGGSNFSYGQRQLMCLARMVLCRPALLLLDEATSAIDPRTQEAVQQAMIVAFKGSTVIAIAHELETVLDFDLVLVFDKGQVVERGPVKELSELRGGIFASMLAASQKCH